MSITSDCPPFADKSRKDEAQYHPRLTYVEREEEEEASEAESYDQQSRSDGSYSPRRPRLSSGASSGEESSPRRRPGPKKLSSVSPTSPRKPEHERMFDDSDDDSSTEKEGTNLNWTLADVPAAAPSLPGGTAKRQSGPPGSKVSVSGSGLINLCATVPPVPGSGSAVPPPAAGLSHTAQEGKYSRTKVLCTMPKTRTLLLRVFFCIHYPFWITAITM